MPPELLNLLTQAPVVAVFIWFVLKWSGNNQSAMDNRDEQMRLFLREQREQDREILSRMIAQLEKIDAALAAHDERAADGIRTIVEQVKPRERVLRERRQKGDM